MTRLRGPQTGISCGPELAMGDVRSHRGIDFLKISFWVDWQDDGKFLDNLEVLKKGLQETEDLESCAFRDAGLDWNIQRTGTSKYSYILKSGDVTLMFSRRSGSHNMPNFRLEMGSLSSQTDLYRIYGDIKWWIERRADFVKEQVSEVHLSVDFLGVSLQSLGIDDQRYWVQRAVTFAPYYEHRTLTGISIGKGDLMLRVYDKVTELQRSTHKQAIFAELWGVKKYDDVPVTRVEYQLRRPVLKEFEHQEYCDGIKTVKSLMMSIKSLWRYCTAEWARFHADIVDRKNRHQDRIKLHGFWAAVQNVKWFGVSRLRRCATIAHKDIDKLAKQARGLAMSITAFFVSNPRDINRIVYESKKMIDKELRTFFREDYSKFVKNYMRKRNEAVLDTVPF